MMVALLIEMIFTVGAKLDVESRRVIKPTLSCLTFQVPVMES